MPSDSGVIKKIAISQSNYVPWKGYFDSIHMVDKFILFDDAQFTKRDWRNRNRIKTKEGPQWITIPVEVKGKFHQKICQTKVSDPAWAERHWRTISLHYSRANYFDDLRTTFQDMYRQSAELLFLSDINLFFTQRICDMLKIRTVLQKSCDFHLIEGKTERLIDLCRQAGATDYFSGPTAKAYLEESRFREANIRVHYFDYQDYPTYRQLYGEFVHEVSIIDLLFNEGPNAIRYLKSFNSYESADPE